MPRHFFISIIYRQRYKNRLKTKIEPHKNTPKGRYKIICKFTKIFLDYGVGRVYYIHVSENYS